MGTLTIRDFFADAALTVSGHLRRPPDPVWESALRTAFAELDSELAAVLGHPAPPALAALTAAARP